MLISKTSGIKTDLFLRRRRMISYWHDDENDTIEREENDIKDRGRNF